MIAVSGIATTSIAATASGVGRFAGSFAGLTGSFTGTLTPVPGLEGAFPVFEGSFTGSLVRNIPSFAALTGSFSGSLTRLYSDFPLEDIFPNCSFDETNVIIPLADISGLTAEDAHAVTGDWVMIVHKMLSAYKAHQESLSAPDQPVSMRIFSTERESFETGDSDDETIVTKTETIKSQFLISFATETIVEA